ncbi:GDSL-like Lipase/Acylhydrolase [Thalassoglobus neptunius]|uniref:GDSL-like Lipase/Acylhydrolase n=2 Tax=Thalassoglobus neptunius TaxID=1938619 RepID=A0A5C5WX66_9PLAN|nr:GDSL-like Lipase/Acylhydrolase [Thalassoglobus neptunius]
MTPSNLDRRTFIQAVATGAGAVGIGKIASGQETASGEGSWIQPKSTILFQGDSITDAGRQRDSASVPNKQPGLGNGYAWMAASQLLVAHSDDQLKIFNRGISGNKVFQLANRWDADCLQIKPDVLSILIGVNDIWHRRNGKYDGTIATYRKDYDALLARTVDKLPNVKLVVCEPFLLECGVIDESWWPEFNPFREASREIAEKFGARFVAFQDMFNEAVQYAPPEYWARDGVHPSPYGAQLMAGEWIRVVNGSDADFSARSR